MCPTSYVGTFLHQTNETITSVWNVPVVPRVRVVGVTDFALCVLLMTVGHPAELNVAAIYPQMIQRCFSS